MFALERIRLIKSYLEDRRQAEVRALSALLDVSEVTIRRDLEKLESEGFLVRTHGGAILAEEARGREEDYAEDSASAVRGLLSKISVESAVGEIGDIGRTAARLVADGDTVMILSGRLGRSLSRALAEHQNLTILTNDLVVAAEAARSGDNRVVILGGDLNGRDLAVSGAVAADDIRRFHVDRLFAQVDGFGQRFELSVRTQEQALLIREGRSHCREFVVLCEGAAFGENAFFSFGNAESGDLIVTGRSLTDEDKRRLFDANLRLYTAVDIYEGAVPST